MLRIDSVGEDRLKQWLAALSARTFVEQGRLDLEFFTTRERLTPAQAQSGPWRPIAPGERWGALWEYGWFRGALTIPAALAGRRVLAILDTGAEMLSWRDGVARVERFDTSVEHWLSPNCLTLAAAARGGETVAILAEGLGGKGARPNGGGPVLPGVDSVPDLGERQAAFAGCRWGVWQEAVHEAWLDCRVLDELRRSLPETSWRRAEIERALQAFTLAVDPEADDAAFLAAVAAGRALLAPHLARRNGPSAPVFLGVGHGHLDVAWKWPLEESRRKIARTLAQQLAIVEEFPEHRFLNPQPALHEMLRRDHPELWQRVKRATADGVLIPEGAMWVEPDVNVAGGEALIRQFLHGIRFVEAEYGQRPRLCFLPDVFGYCASLPQILAGCGIEFFVTAKLFWLYHGGDKAPYDTFTWVGCDGSAVKAHLLDSYQVEPTPSALLKSWQAQTDQAPRRERLLCYGFGDGGGGARRDHLSLLRRVADLDGLPRVEITHPLEALRRMDAAGWGDERIVGELYLAIHRGVLTSQAQVKAGNRRAETALREAECWLALAGALGRDASWDGRLRDACWKELLTSQFHDILPGSSIARVNREAEQTFARVADLAGTAAARARAALVAPADALTVCNSLAWPRRALVALPVAWRGAAQDGRALPVQDVDGRLLAEVELPACGHVTVKAADPALAGGDVARAEGQTIENRHLRLTLDARGAIASLFDKDAGRELAAGPLNELRMYQDVPTRYDAWDIDQTYLAQPVALDAPAEVVARDGGPLAASLTVSRRIGASWIRQTYVLERASRRIEIRTEIDWRETHKLLKAAFAFDHRDEEALHGIQFGHVRRPTHRNRRYDRDRFEVAHHRWVALVEEDRGAAVIDDGSKYGADVLGSTISLSLLRAPMAPEQDADKGVHRFTYGLYVWNGAFHASNLIPEAWGLGIAPTVQAGDAGPARSLLSVDRPAVAIEAVKPAEDGSGDVVVRLYESRRSACDAVLTAGFPLESAATCDLLEETATPVAVVGGCAVRLRLRPFQILTLRLRPAR